MKHKLLTASRRDFLKIGGSAVAAASLGMRALATGKTGRIGFAMSGADNVGSFSVAVACKDELTNKNRVVYKMPPENFEKVIAEYG